MPSNPFPGYGSLGGKNRLSLNTAIKKSVTPYLCFVKENRQRVSMENPGMSSKDIMVAMGQMWQKLSPEDRFRYH